MVAAGTTAVTFMDEHTRHVKTWLSITLCSDLTPAARRQLMARYDSPLALINAVSAGELPREIELKRRDKHTETQVERALLWQQSAPDRHILTLSDPRYPAPLAALDLAPTVLYVSGMLDALLAPHVAIVGARKASPAALSVAHELASGLATAGIAVVSGMAIGIDGAAHRGCLAAQGRTVAVAATPADVIYPKRHQQLALDITRSGAIVTEFPLGTPLRASCFPQRNRIISGLCLATVVVEAALPSGSLLTAKHAIEQGREVMVVPGSIRNPQARGCHALIKDGATLIESAEDILTGLSMPLEAHLQAQKAPTNEAATVIKDSDALLLLENLGYDPCSADELTSKTGLSTARVIRALSSLELQGTIKRSTGRYSRC